MNVAFHLLSEGLHAASHPIVFRATNSVVRYPTDPAEMARHYVLSSDDLALIRTKRRAINRLGFAIQLCLLRHPGQGMGPGEHPPPEMIAFIAHQLGLPSAKFGDYALRDQTRREHAVELQRYLQLRSFGFADWRSCLKAGADAAWATDRGEPIVRAMIAHLRANNVVLPTVSGVGADRAGRRGRAPGRRFSKPWRTA